MIDIVNSGTPQNSFIQCFNDFFIVFDGIGHKTASIVLLFCFDKPAFPVDTHVGRVTRRLGLAQLKDSEQKIKAIWESLVPADWYYPLHLNLIRHGRQVCRARAPDCPACVLNDVCRYFCERNGAGI